MTEDANVVAPPIADQDLWIERVRREALTRLEMDGRFIGLRALRENFEATVTEWKQYGKFRNAINFGNEISLALAMLDRVNDLAKLTYEPRLSATAKSVDFHMEGRTGEKAWVDSKTVAPQVSKLQELKARFGFVEKVFDVENKIATFTAAEQAPTYLVFCSDAGNWNRDSLEDFADFYRAGKFRADDWASEKIAEHMAKKGRVFGRTITGFCFLGRLHDEVTAEKFVWDVRGPLPLGSR
jgi:hypothetical protein